MLGCNFGPGKILILLPLSLGLFSFVSLSSVLVLSQLGADVPAESFEMSPVDRIFVRMGAKDHIMAGQSTFLTELLETASMLVCFLATKLTNSCAQQWTNHF